MHCQATGRNVYSILGYIGMPTPVISCYSTTVSTRISRLAFEMSVFVTEVSVNAWIIPTSRIQGLDPRAASLRRLNWFIKKHWPAFRLNKNV